MGNIEKERQLEQLITYEMYELLPVGWTWKWDKSITRWGQCIYTTKTLSFSKPLFMHHDLQEARHTILHEIAHALVGGGHHHDKVWKAKCVELGINPSAKHPTQSTLTAGFKYKGSCPKDHPHYRMRRPSRRISCGSCSPSFDPQHLIKWSAVV